jgi:hypothetical protein
MAAAMEWVSRVFAAALMMVLPGLGGQWLDARWGTQFVGLAGFVVGLVGGVTYLIAVTRRAEEARRRNRTRSSPSDRVSGDQATGSDERGTHSSED